MSILAALQLPPVARGFVIILIAAAAFPPVGIFVFRLNLINVRFMLMHGGLLGGAVALALGLNPLVLTLGINILLVFVVDRMGREQSGNYAYITSFLMVLSMGIAFLIIYKAGVPAKDAMTVLWGNILALTAVDAWLTAGFAAVIVLFIIFFYRKIIALLFNADVAYTSGIDRKGLQSAVIFLVGFTVSLCMRLIGALLLDAIILLPAAIGMLIAGSARRMFIVSSAAGLFSAVLGFVGALKFDVPVSSGIIIAAAGIWAAAFIYMKIRRKRGVRKWEISSGSE